MRDERTLAHLADAELVELAQKGQRAAFESLFHRHQDRIYTLALSILGDPSDAKDVVQETFVRAYRRLSHLRGDSGVLSYLCRTATNAAIDIIRERKGAQAFSVEAFAESGFDFADHRATPQHALEKRVENDALFRALTSLPIDQRIVVVLHHLEGKQVEEIARILKIPAGTVKSRLGRGREALRRKLMGKVIP